MALCAGLAGQKARHLLPRAANFCHQTVDFLQHCHVVMGVGENQTAGDVVVEVIQILCQLATFGEIERALQTDHDAAGNAVAPSSAPNAYTPNDFVAEDKLERKAAAHSNHFYDEVIRAVHDSDSIHIMGPGEAKLEFKKRIDGAKLKGHIAPLETMDKMSERQIAAHVRQIVAKSIQSTYKA